MNPENPQSDPGEYFARIPQPTENEQRIAETFNQLNTPTRQPLTPRQRRRRAELALAAIAIPVGIAKAFLVEGDFPMYPEGNNPTETEQETPPNTDEQLATSIIDQIETPGTKISVVEGKIVVSNDSTPLLAAPSRTAPHVSPTSIGLPGDVSVLNDPMVVHSGEDTYYAAFSPQSFPQPVFVKVAGEHQEAHPQAEATVAAAQFIFNSDTKTWRYVPQATVSDRTQPIATIDGPNQTH